MKNNPVYRNHDGTIITIKPIFDGEIAKVVKAELPDYFDNSQGGEDVDFDPFTGEERSSRDD
jgi:hypothetical protein